MPSSKKIPEEIFIKDFLKGLFRKIKDFISLYYDKEKRFYNLIEKVQNNIVYK